MARILATSGFRTRILEFPGQNGRPGAYSVKTSCEGLCLYLEAAFPTPCSPVFLFGICTGALAALHAAAHVDWVTAVFCWELAASYQYTRDAHQSLVDQFGLSVDWEHALLPVQAADLLPEVQQQICLGVAARSRCTTLTDQEHLRHLACRAHTCVLDKTSHVPGIPRGSELVVAEALGKWCEQQREIEA